MPKSGSTFLFSQSEPASLSLLFQPITMALPTTKEKVGHTREFEQRENEKWVSLTFSANHNGAAHRIT